MNDLKRRSFVKSLSWRIFASFLLSIAVFIQTNKMHISVFIFVMDFIVKIIFYYFHERIWEHIKYGKVDEKS